MGQGGLDKFSVLAVIAWEGGYGRGGPRGMRPAAQEPRGMNPAAQEQRGMNAAARVGRERGG